MIRRVFYLVSAAVIAFAAFNVPMPQVELAPGAAPAISPLVQIEHEVTPIDGELHLLTVRVTQPSLVGSLRAWLDDRRSLEPRRAVIPAGIDPDVFFEQQRRTFQLSFEVAAAVGARQAGYEVQATTAPVIVDLIPGGPADGTLRAGDLVLAVDGQPVDSVEQLVDLAGQAEIGATLPLTIVRGGQELDVEVEVGQTAEMEQPGLGVYVQTTIRNVDLPFEITLGQTRIGGPSAGMMMALTVYDLLAEEDLAAGRVVAGTGTVSLSGRVGRISGIAEKVAAAERIGAQVLLVPRSLEPEALDARRDENLRIVGVDTVEEAIAALRE